MNKYLYLYLKSCTGFAALASIPLTLKWNRHSLRCTDWNKGIYSSSKTADYLFRLPIVASSCTVLISTIPIWIVPFLYFKYIDNYDYTKQDDGCERCDPDF